VIYTEIPGFEHVFLEDSWVLDIAIDPLHVIFHVDLVLTDGHPLYRPRPEDEQYCYMLAKIQFDAVARVEWRNRPLTPSWVGSPAMPTARRTLVTWKK
jgi:hypothetical protein